MRVEEACRKLVPNATSRALAAVPRAGVQGQGVPLRVSLRCVSAHGQRWSITRADFHKIARRQLLLDDQQDARHVLTTMPGIATLDAVAMHRLVEHTRSLSYDQHMELSFASGAHLTTHVLKARQGKSKDVSYLIKAGAITLNLRRARKDGAAHLLPFATKLLAFGVGEVLSADALNAAAEGGGCRFELTTPFVTLIPLRLDALVLPGLSSLAPSPGDDDNDSSDSDDGDGGGGGGGAGAGVARARATAKDVHTEVRGSPPYDWRCFMRLASTRHH